MAMDQDWCATSILVRVRAGDYEGTNLSGQSAVVGLFFPDRLCSMGMGLGEFISTAEPRPISKAHWKRFCRVSPEGVWKCRLACCRTGYPLNTRRSRSTHKTVSPATIRSDGEMVSERLVNDLGDKMTMQDVAFALAFQFEGNSADIAPGDGTSWNDPEMPQPWVGKSGAVGKIAWKGA